MSSSANKLYGWFGGKLIIKLSMRGICFGEFNALRLWRVEKKCTRNLNTLTV